MNQLSLLWSVFSASWRLGEVHHLRQHRANSSTVVCFTVFLPCKILRNLRTRTASLVFLLFFRYIQFIPIPGLLHSLCSLPFPSHLKHPSSGGPFPPLTQPVLPTSSAWSLFVPLRCFTFSHSIFIYLFIYWLPEIVLFMVITCFWNYLLLDSSQWEYKLCEGRQWFFNRWS